MKTNALSGVVRALSIGGLALMLLAPTTQAQGRNAPAVGGDDTTRLNAVQVTGSRIKKSESTGTSPVLTITAKDLEATGLASVGDVLAELSVSGSSLNTKFNSAGNFGFPASGAGVGSGSSTISLRNLGAQRTLVLVDGLRWVNESSASGVSGAVDLNTIPLAVVDRIEILADGASALYGSDAIGGVVNIITKKTQDGAALHAYYGHHTTGKGNTLYGDISLGGKYDKGSFILDISHFDQGSISSNTWDQSSIPVPGTGLSNASSATPFGKLKFTTDGTDPGGLCPIPDMAIKHTCSVTPNGGKVPPTQQAFPDDYHTFGDADRFNFAPYNDLLTPQRRSAIFGQGTYDLTKNIQWYLKGEYQSRHSVNEAAPEPIFLGPDAGTGGLPDTIIIDPSNPYFPSGVNLDANHVVVVTRRPVEGGDRVFSQDVNTRYFSTGVQGDFELLQRKLNWDVNYAGATNDATQTVTGTYNARHIQTALGPVANCFNPCVPLDIFDGPGTITPAMLNYILFTEHDVSRQSLELATANLSGTLVRLPWSGDVDLAVGYEHRRYDGSYSPDQIIVQGDSNGVPSGPTAGSYTVNEYYAELSVPLLANMPAVKHLDLSLATRYSSYVPFGGTTKSKVGLRWQPDDQLTLRLNYAGGFRAPTIGEAFGTVARFDATLVDHCDQSSKNPAPIKNCEALGVPDGFSQDNPQISVQTGGNPQLKPETSHNFSVGFVYSPSWAYGKPWANKLDFEVTYYRILMSNIINATDAQTKLNNCEYGGDPNAPACEGIGRDPTTGTINRFNDSLQNLSSADTNGIDFSLNWLSPRYVYGRFGTNWQTTLTGKFNINGQPDAVGIEAHDSGIPRFKSTLRLNWDMGPVSATWAVRYLSALREDCAGAAGFAICDTAPDSGFVDGSHKMPEVFYDDVQASYKLPIPKVKASVSAGINNVFQQGAPICLSCSLNGYDASNYDLPGRFIYVESTVRF